MKLKNPNFAILKVVSYACWEYKLNSGIPVQIEQWEGVGSSIYSIFLWLRLDYNTDKQLPNVGISVAAIAFMYMLYEI